jgi:hypothetical protein
MLGENVMPSTNFSTSFTVDLRSDFECFDTCSSAWGFFVNGSLRHLITTGKGPSTPPWETAA